MSASQEAAAHELPSSTQKRQTHHIAVSLLPQDGPLRRAVLILATRFALTPASSSQGDELAQRWYYRPARAERGSDTAASMRSAMRGPVKPTSACSRAGLPWVT